MNKAAGAGLLALFIGVGIVAVARLGAQATPQSDPRALFDTYCVTCHNQKLHTAGVVLDAADLSPELRERVILKLRAGLMPPPGRPRPDAATYKAVAAALENEIDKAWAAN